VARPSPSVDMQRLCIGSRQAADPGFWAKQTFKVTVTGSVTAAVRPPAAAVCSYRHCPAASQQWFGGVESQQVCTCDAASSGRSFVSPAQPDGRAYQVEWS